jgi:hypothetical protein
MLQNPEEEKITMLYHALKSLICIEYLFLIVLIDTD